MAECVCIDTTPQSPTAVWGQRSPAGGQLNDKVNEGGLDSGMPRWAITGEERRLKIGMDMREEGIEN